MGFRSDEYVNSKDAALDVAIDEAFRTCPEMESAFHISGT